MICVTCQWLWENLDRPGEKFVQGNWLAEEDTRFQKKKKKIIILCVAATMDTVLEKMGKLNLVMLLDYRYFYEWFNQRNRSFSRCSRKQRIPFTSCICTSRSTQFLPRFLNGNMSYMIPRKRKKKEIYSSLPSINDRWSWTNSNRQSDDNRVPAGLIKCGWDHDDIHHPA